MTGWNRLNVALCHIKILFILSCLSSGDLTKN